MLDPRMKLNLFLQCAIAISCDVTKSFLTLEVSLKKEISEQNLVLYIYSCNLFNILLS